MSKVNTIIKEYLQSLTDVINRFPVDELEQIYSVINDAREMERTIFICGNGGSWATAAHMVSDYSKNTRQPGMKRLRMIGLGDNIPNVTAYANDEGYDRVFAEPLLSLMQPGDVLIAISGSGNSPNVLRAVEVAQKVGGTIVGLTGYQGGKLKPEVDHCLIIPSDSLEMIEDFHMIIDHILTLCLRNEE